MFPESVEHVIRRAVRVAQNAAEYFIQQNKSTSKSVCLLNVSHGCHVDTVCHLSEIDGISSFTPLQYASLTDSQKEEIVQVLTKEAKYKFPDYCSITGYNISGDGKEQWVF